MVKHLRRATLALSLAASLAVVPAALASGGGGTAPAPSSAVILPGTTVGAFADAPAPFSTPYTVTLSVIDFHFNTLTQTSASITTKKPQQVNG